MSRQWDDRTDRTIDEVMWISLLILLGTILFIAKGSDSAIWTVVAGVIAYLAAAVLFCRLMFGRRRD